MDTRYNAADHEDLIYQLWLDNQAFSPNDSADSSYTIIMPPPNANDPLHIGHAMFLALEDVLIRHHRMKGEASLWLPGTDHAGIETQYVFEKKLKKKGQSRFQFDRDTLYQMIWDYVQENSDVAVNQMKKIGASADWDRFRFMLDEDIVEIVLDTFKKLHDDNLIYRDLRLVNYSPKAGTAYSELEINYIERIDPLYYVRYPLQDALDTYVTVATVRPEPIFADTHLAVHPDNPKTKRLIGKYVLNPLTDEPMEIITDEFVDPEFGTGIVKLTPAHDHNDFEVAKKHNLPINQAINTSGKITEAGGKYAGMNVKKARQAVVEDLQAKGLIEKINEKYSHRVGTCYKTGGDIEPLPLPQFFVKVAPLVEPVLAGLDSGEITVHGAGHDKILRHWLTNLRDWNISRQIVWGIRIPVWYKITGNEDKLSVGYLDDNKKFHQAPLSQALETHDLTTILSGLQTLTAAASLDYTISITSPGDDYIQETDTFDTWFSSAQWPFSTLQSLGKEDFQKFYPTQVMETGYDILPFWVMRMLMLGKFATGEFPFKDIYLHGLVRDQHGKKMSKSKGNVINPLEIIDKYGADALRMALVIRSSAGLDKSVSEGDFKAMRNFTNKLWNAARFVTLMDDSPTPQQAPGDQEFIQKLNQVITDVTQQLTDMKLGMAADTLFNEFWHWFCDECIESAKKNDISIKNLNIGLRTFVIMLHPFMPFVTEKIWQELFANEQTPLLINSSWPSPTLE